MDESLTTTADQPTKLPVMAHVMCGWPLCLLFIGGAVGGGLGGAAYAINVGIYKSTLPSAIKVLLNVSVGIAAFVLWVVIAMAIQYAWG